MINIEDYRPELFFNQVGQIKKIQALVERMIAGEEDIYDRAIIFTGVRGSGKSWLSLHVSRHVFKDRQDVSPFLISLLPGHTSTRMPNEWWPEDEQTTRDLEFAPAAAIESILDQLAVRMGVSYGPKDSLEDKSRRLASDLGRRNFSQILLIIVDSAFESPRAGLDDLQRYITTPLLHSGRVAVVVTGRGTQPAWDSPYLRDAEKIPLTAWESTDAVEIIKVSNGKLRDRVDDILRYSGGYPLSVRMLSEWENGDMRQALDRLIDHLLSVVTDPDIRSRVLKYVKCLAVLEDPFRDDDVLTLLAGDGQASAPIHFARAMRDLLQTYNLMEWVDRGGSSGSGYAINDSLRLPVLGFLQDFEEPEWQKYQGRASHRFEELADRFKSYPKAYDYYSQQAKKYQPDNTKTHKGDEK